jgi:hypothetical protein
MYLISEGIWNGQSAEDFPEKFKIGRSGSCDNWTLQIAWTTCGIRQVIGLKL